MKVLGTGGPRAELRV